MVSPIRSQILETFLQEEGFRSVFSHHTTMYFLKKCYEELVCLGSTEYWYFVILTLK